MAAVRGRQMTVVAFLGFVFVLAGLLAAHRSVWWLAPVIELGHFQVFHVVGHFGIFAAVVVLYGPQERSAARLWAVILSGAVLLEAVQVVVGGRSFTRAWLLDSTFDIMVDIAGAAACWFVVMRSRRRRVSPRYPQASRTSE